MTVTAMASTSHPNGSPTRWATTSACCTAASTAPASSSAARTTGAEPISRPHVSASAMSAAIGTTTVHDSRSHPASIPITADTLIDPVAEPDSFQWSLPTSQDNALRISSIRRRAA